jgi:hypothetical protein
MSTTTVAQSRSAQALRQSPHPALRNLAVEETDEVIILSGRVTTYYLKQVAQETIMPVRAGKQLVNRIRVERG